ncbi:MAG TPA: flavin reductase family protein [Solirubrobacterales bacterium]|nr:flavin reductase family protein [Solirubrobacterales bacterium]
MPAPDPAEFRAAMAQIPSGVTVVSALASEGPAGATASAVASLSLDPMLMLACLDRGSRTLLAVQAANRFGINVLESGQEAIARRFSTKAAPADKWDGIAWRDAHDVPAIDGALVFVCCELHDVIAGGDHVIVTGSVEGLTVGEGQPLLYHRGEYGTVGDGSRRSLG